MGIPSLADLDLSEQIATLREKIKESITRRQAVARIEISDAILVS